MLQDSSNTGSSMTDQCRSYLEYHHYHPKRPSDEGTWPPPGPAVTISAQLAPEQMRSRRTLPLFCRVKSLRAVARGLSLIGNLWK
jgi:hypothetical protein